MTSRQWREAYRGCVFGVVLFALITLIALIVGAAQAAGHGLAPSLAFDIAKAGGSCLMVAAWAAWEAEQRQPQNAGRADS